MDKYRAPHLLDANAEKKEEVEYFKQYTKEELDDVKDMISSVSIDMDNAMEAKKEASKEFNEKLKECKEKLKEALKIVRFKGQNVKEQCYLFIDIEEKRAGYYNSKGELVYDRPLKAEEFQTNIYQLKKAE